MKGLSCWSTDFRLLKVSSVVIFTYKGSPSVMQHAVSVESSFLLLHSIKT